MWKYTFSPQYSPLKEGSNKITAKLSCQPENRNFFSSINVTGSNTNCHYCRYYYGGG
jgi:hypothetical protein